MNYMVHRSEHDRTDLYDSITCQMTLCPGLDEADEGVQRLSCYSDDKVRKGNSELKLP